MDMKTRYKPDPRRVVEWKTNCLEICRLGASDGLRAAAIMRVGAINTLTKPRALHSS